MEYPAYGPKLAPGNYHLFPALKRKLGGHRFKELDVETVVNDGK
jgi:hypothetical protein